MHPRPAVRTDRGNLDAARTQRLANLLGRLRILRGVAQKDRSARVAHGALIKRWLAEELAFGVVGHSRALRHRPGSLPQAVNGRSLPRFHLFERLKLARQLPDTAPGAGHSATAAPVA